MSGEDYTDGDSTILGGSSSAGPKSRKGPRFSWTPQYETTFFQSLCDSVRLGLKDNHSFKPEAWDRAALALQTHHGAYPNKGHLINKSDNARKKFRLWRGLREDPAFVYNENTRMVTGSDDAWKIHMEKEPLSRSLKGRPFDHEDFMEVLFPDVVGSGGAPKRMTKQRRRDTGTLPGQDDIESSNTTVLGLLDDNPFVAAPQQQQIAHGGHIPTPVQQPTEVPLPLPPAPPPQIPTATVIPPSRRSIPSANALTPPEENGPAHTRKRYMAPDATTQTGGYTPADKRRRTAPNAFVDLSHAPTQQQTGVNGSGRPPAPQQQPTPAATTVTTASASASQAQAAAAQQAAAAAAATAAAGQAAAAAAQNHQGGGPASAYGHSGVEDLILQMAEAVKAARQPRWPEQAMEIFFRDFGDEDLDLQVKIAEKALTDTNKAIMFCKMTPELRRCWVKRLRELFNRIGLGN